MYYYYKLIYCDEFDGYQLKDKEGIISAGKTYASAAKALDQYYGTGTGIEEIVCLKPISDASALEIPHEAAQIVKEISDF